MASIYQKFKQLPGVTKLLVLIFSILIIAVLLIYIWVNIIVPNYFTPKTNVSGSLKTYEITELASIANTINTADAQEAFNKRVDESIKNNKYTDQEKAKLYIYQSSVAYNLEKYQEAYDYASQSEQLYPSTNSAELMADSLINLNNKQEAIIYFNKAIERITGTDLLSEKDKEHIREKIQKLST